MARTRIPKYQHTKNCLWCGKKAISWTGHTHVTEKRHFVISGWCNDHIHDYKIHQQLLVNAEKCPGCYGKWKEKYGMKWI